MCTYTLFNFSLSICVKKKFIYLQYDLDIFIKKSTTTVEQRYEQNDNVNSIVTTDWRGSLRGYVQGDHQKVIWWRDRAWPPHSWHTSCTCGDRGANSSRGWALVHNIGMYPLLHMYITKPSYHIFLYSVYLYIYIYVYV